MAPVEAGEGVGRQVAPAAVVVETKLTPPRVRSEHVLRSDLLAILRDSGPRAFTLVAAPPGFGKTTVLAQWLAAMDGPRAAWLSLDEDDNDPARFFACVVAALRTTEPDFGVKALGALQSPGASLADVVLPLLINELATLGRGTVLVLDDYHVIVNPAIHEALAYLLAHLPQSVRLALATREDPPLPLGRLRARGDLVELRAHDLRFTDDETRQFLSEGLALDLELSDVERLQTRTEGWPAALYLAALSLRGQPDPGSFIDAFAGDDRYIVDYLTAEVLARQPPELRSFLLHTSILTRMCAGLCDAVSERNDSSTLLAGLERSNLLLVPLDVKREWYRYHHLFGDLLRHELSGTEPGLVAELHRRAFAWYRDAGLIVDAANHASAAGDTTAAVELVARHYAFFVGQGQLATVMRWIDLLSETAAAEDWLLGFAAAVVTAHAGQLEEAERWLAIAERAPQVARDGVDPVGPLAAVTAMLCLLRGDIAGTISNERRVLEAAGTPTPDWALAPQVALGGALWWSPGTDEAKPLLEAAARGARAAGIPATAMYALAVRAAIALDEDDTGLAEALADEALELMRREELLEHPWGAVAWVVHGTLLCRRGDLSAASEAVERGLVLGERLRAWQVTAYASMALAEVRQRQHEPAEARRLLTRVRELLEALPDPGTGMARLEQTEKMLKLRASRDRAAPSAPFWELSERELVVLRLFPSELSQREMAAELYVSVNTVKTQTRAIFAKLGVNSRAEAVVRARELGLI